MSTASTASTPMARPWAGWAWWALLAVLAWAGADFLRTGYLKYHAADPAHLGLFSERPGWLYTHLAGGTLTLVLGWLQLLAPRLAPSRPVHRWVGRAHLVGLLIGATGGLGLILSSPAPTEIRVAFACTLLAWLGTAAVGVVAVRQRRLAQHRRWMLRHYTVTLAPVVFRLMLPAALAAGWVPSPTLIAGLLWASWVAPWLVFEVVLRLTDRRSLPTPSGTLAA